MLSYFLKRAIFMLPQAILLSMLIFFLAHPATRLLFLGMMAPYEFFQSFGQMIAGYGNWLMNFLQGDLGRSMVSQMPVADLLLWRLNNTVYLSLLALLLMYLMAVPMALVSAKNASNWKERLLTAVSYLGFALPSFLFTLLAMYLFGFRLGWFPTGNSVPPGMNPQIPGYLWARFYHMLLPAFCIAAVTMMPMYHYLKNEMIQFSNHPMTLTARSKGCSEKRLYHKHIFRNSLLPITSSFGFQLASLLGATLFVEMFFSYPGMGQLFLAALQHMDQDVIAAVIMLYSGATIMGSCLSDTLTVMIDPRIRMK